MRGGCGLNVDQMRANCRLSLQFSPPNFIRAAMSQRLQTALFDVYSIACLFVVRFPAFCQCYHPPTRPYRLGTSGRRLQRDPGGRFVVETDGL